MNTVKSEDIQKRQTFNTFLAKPYCRGYFKTLSTFKSDIAILSIDPEAYLAEAVKKPDPTSFKFNKAK